MATSWIQNLYFKLCLYGIVFNFQVSDKGFPNEEEEKLSNKNITLEIWDVNDESPIFIKPLETVFVSDVSTYIQF